MTKDTEQKTQDLLLAMNDKDIKNEAMEIKNSNPLQVLGEDLIDFFTTRLQHINKIEESIEIATEELNDRVMNDKKITFSELRIYLNNLLEQASLANESIISLLRPVQNTQNPLLTNILNKDQKSDGDLNLSSDQMKSFDRLFRVLKKFEDEEKK
jgi:hypothetical protein